MRVVILKKSVLFLAFVLLGACGDQSNTSAASSAKVETTSAVVEVKKAVDSDGHNGILFSMSQKDLEALGFKCKPFDNAPLKKLGLGIVIDNIICRHPDMVGQAFGQSLANYDVSLTAAGDKILFIDAKITSSIRRIDDLLAVGARVQEFYPIEIEQKKQPPEWEKVIYNMRYRKEDGSMITLEYSDLSREYKMTMHPKGTYKGQY